MFPHNLKALSLLSLGLSIKFVFSAEHNHHARKHGELAKRMAGDVDVQKRDTNTNARFTFFEVGLGACGIYNSDNDFIVALNTPQFTQNGNGYPGPECFKMITIQYGGKSTQAQITDECPGCPWGGLDMSPGLFSFFADEGAGVLYGDWWYDDGSDSAPTTQYVAPSTQAWTAPSTQWQPTTTTTTTWTPPPSSTTTTTTWTTTTTTATTTATTTTTSSAPTSTAPEVFGNLNQIMLGLGGMIAAGRH